MLLHALKVNLLMHPCNLVSYLSWIPERSCGQLDMFRAFCQFTQFLNHETPKCACNFQIAQSFVKFANCVNIATQSINDLYRVRNFKIALHNLRLLQTLTMDKKLLFNTASRWLQNRNYEQLIHIKGVLLLRLNTELGMLSHFWWNHSLHCVH